MPRLGSPLPARLYQGVRPLSVLVPPLLLSGAIEAATTEAADRRPGDLNQYIHTAE